MGTALKTNNTVRIIPLTNGKFAIIDKADQHLVGGSSWCFNIGYAARSSSNRDLGVHYLMHRLIIGAKKGEFVDHINGNKLDNRRSNLRLSSKSQNRCNTRTPISNTSGYKGVSWHKRQKKWHAQVKMNGKNHHIGYYDDPEKAHQAYLEKAKGLHGEFFPHKTNVGC